jgi:predicted nucleic acid-binding protein
MTVLIDSWAWIEYFKNGKHSTEAMNHVEGTEEALVSTINLLEIYSWVSKFYNDTIATQKIAVIEKRSYVIPVERDIAILAARLKSKHKLGIADAVVLATARKFNAKVVTGDPDFKRIEGVIFIGE